MDWDNKLKLAIIETNSRAAIEAIKGGANANNVVGAYGESALHLAAKNGDIELARLLLSDQSVDINKQDIYSQTALYVATTVENYSIELINLLLSHPKVEINLTAFNDYQSPLYIALIGKKGDIARLLVEHGAEITLDTLPKVINIIGIDKALIELNALKDELSALEYFKLEKEIKVQGKIEELMAMPSLKPAVFNPYSSDALLFFTFTEQKLNSVTNMYEKFYNKSLFTQSILDGVILKNVLLANSNTKIILAKDSNDIAYIDSAYEDNQVIGVLDGSLEGEAIILHEIAHMFFDQLFNNDCNPYSQDNLRMYTAYESAAKNMLVSVAQDFLDIDFKDKNLDSMDSHQIAKFIEENSFVDLLSMFLLIKIWSPYFDLDAPKVTLKLPDTITELCDKYKVSDEESETTGGILEYLISKANQIIAEKQFTTDEVVLLGRIGDFVSRDEDSYDQELIVRLPELEFYGLDGATMLYFEPIADYWKQYIIPEVNKLKLEQQETCYEIFNTKIDNQLVCESSYNTSINCIEEFLI